MNSVAETDRSFAVTRTFQAPRDLVLQMWSHPENITHWWGPAGFTTTTHQMDFRPGGEWLYTMHGPDGTDYPNAVKYIQTGPDTIEYDHGDEPGNTMFHVVVTLKQTTPLETVCEFKMVFPSPESYQAIINSNGARDGLHNTLSRLSVVLEARQTPSADQKLVVKPLSDLEILLQRSFQAPRDLVFEVFTNAEHLKNWWSPYAYTITEARFDQQEGGEWYVQMAVPEQGEIRFFGQVRQFVRPERLRYTFNLDVMPGEISQDTATFIEEQPGRTTVTVQSLFTSKESRDGMLSSGMEQGAAQSYERLETILTRQNPDLPRFVHERVFQTDPETLFQAWADQNAFAQWWGPQQSKNTIKQFIFEPQGTCHYQMEFPNQDPMFGKFTYRQIEPGKSLVFASGFADDQGNLVPAPWFDHWPLQVLTFVDFIPEGNNTNLVLTAIPLDATPEQNDQFQKINASMQQGWAGTFDKLDDHLAN